VIDAYLRKVSVGCIIAAADEERRPQAGKLEGRRSPELEPVRQVRSRLLVDRILAQLDGNTTYHF